MKFKIIHHADQRAIDEMYQNYSPIFVLSTGRSGSKFIVNILNLCTNISAFHEPRPTLQYFSNYAFHHQKEKKVLSSIINSARMELILEIFIKNNIYVESNQCLNFFAPAIAGLFKQSRFVHLVRHPGDFVRSAVRKGWHKNDSIWESGRVKMGDEKKWAQMDQIERLSWLWTVTNQYIESFKKNLQPTTRKLTLKFEDLTEGEDGVLKLWEFVGGEAIGGERMKKIQKRKTNEIHIHPDEPPNMKKILDFSLYHHWQNELKNKLKTYASDLADLYGYSI